MLHAFFSSTFAHFTKLHHLQSISKCHLKCGLWCSYFIREFWADLSSFPRQGNSTQMWYTSISKSDADAYFIGNDVNFEHFYESDKGRKAVIHLMRFRILSIKSTEVWVIQNLIPSFSLLKYFMTLSLRLLRILISF